MELLRYSDPMLRWISIVLSERFGHDFKLEQHDRNSLRLFLANDRHEVVFAQNPTIFTRSDSNLHFSSWDAESDGWFSVLGSPIPAPGVEAIRSPLIKKIPNGIYVSYDIIGLAYWMLSRQEEIGRTDLDIHSRFPAASSHAFKNGYLERPIVDEWLNVLGQIIEQTWPGIVLKQNQFAINVSHDVDVPSRYGFLSWRKLIRAMIGDLVRRRELKAPLFAPIIRIKGRRELHAADPANTFDWIMSNSEKKGLRSAFYFISKKFDLHSDGYDIDSPAIRSLLKRIHKRGHEIGLHPSYYAYRNPEVIAEEANRLRRICFEEGIDQNVWGGRMHFLRWEHPLTLRAWSDAKMDYDSTLCYADHPGFRCGTCFDYQAFDPVKQEILPLRIKPLIAMDVSIMEKCYLGLGDGKDAIQYIQKIKSICGKVGGTFSLLWHNCNLASNNRKRLYCAALS
jgi:hypothetical protein